MTNASTMQTSEVRSNVSQNNHNVVGPQYALEVAFQTLKDRCRSLTQKLTKVEEENIQLKIQGRIDHSTLEISNSEEVDMLKSRIIELSSQKNRLADRIEILTNENKQLWSKVARVSGIIAPDSTDSQQSEADHSNLRIGVNDILYSGAISGSHLKKNGLVDNILSTGMKTDSLEEISLKLINGFFREKAELEEQFAQMTGLEDRGPSASFSTDQNGFSISSYGAPDDDADIIDSASLNEIQRLFDSLRHIKQDVLLQQEILKSSVKELFRIRPSGLTCHACQEKAYPRDASRISTATTSRLESATIAEPESLGDSAGEEIKEGLRNVTGAHISGDRTNPVNCEKVCPICGLFYAAQTPFEVFHRHVVSHFEDDVYLDIINDRFEVVPAE